MRFPNWKPPTLEHGKLNEYNWLVLNPEGLQLGKYTDIGALSVLMCKSGVKIGDNVQLGAGVKVYSEDTISGSKMGVTIHKDSCIGANSVILPGVVIDAGALIAACSVVGKNQHIPAGEIWGGNPARPIGIIRHGKRVYGKGLGRYYP